MAQAAKKRIVRSSAGPIKIVHPAGGDRLTALRQALRNAIERSAARFYQMLAPKASNDETRAFLERMADEETSHAEAFEQTAGDLELGALPNWADFNLEHADALADMTPDKEVQDFFRHAAAREGKHVKAVASLIEEHENA
jgi:rubrerythrin